MQKGFNSMLARATSSLAHIHNTVGSWLCVHEIKPYLEYDNYSVVKFCQCGTS